MKRLWNFSKTYPDIQQEINFNTMGMLCKLDNHNVNKYRKHWEVFQISSSLVVAKYD